MTTREEIVARLIKAGEPVTEARVRAAAAARALLARQSGRGAAATWAVALYGVADRDTVNCIAHDGVRDAEAALAKWRGRLADLDAISAG